LSYGSETWSVTLRGKDTLSVFGNRVRKKLLRPKRKDVVVELRRLHNEELHNSYSLPNIIMVIKTKRMRWAEHVALMGELRKTTKFWPRD